MASRRPPRRDPRLAGRGDRLVAAMHRQGIFKQHALAHQLGVNESTVTRWKNNEAISVEHAVAVCDALSITLDWFLCGLGPMERSVSHDDDWRSIPGPPDGFEDACGTTWRHEPAWPAVLM